MRHHDKLILAPIDETRCTTPLPAPPVPWSSSGSTGLTSWDALCWACGETSRLGGRTVAVFVGRTSAATTAAASFGGAAVAYGAIQQTMIDQAEGLANQIRRYALDHGVELTFVHTHGDMATELLRIASSDHADLIVVGRSTKARHHLAGSLGRRLVGDVMHRSSLSCPDESVATGDLAF